MSLPRPVALFFFNRPRHLERVFARVREVKPAHLMLVCDGPRRDVAGEADAVQACRDVVERIDWPCEVTRLYAEENMGCRDRIASGIRATFDRYESAIFLEDDCLPKPSFFGYCDELLQRYEADDAVAFISGTRFIRLPKPIDDASYQFCRMPLVWGWASWRSAWEGYDALMPSWPNHEQAIRHKLMHATRSLDESIALRVTNSVVSAFTNCYRQTLNTWDHPLAYHLMMQDRRCIIPRDNLVTNIGFGPLSTHSGRIPTQVSLTASDIARPLTHPAESEIDPHLDAAVWKNCFLNPMLGEPVLQRIAHRVKRAVQKQVFKRWDRG
jgi:hypothetical protein